jgi:hypothetical protein
LSHDALEGDCRSTTNPEFPKRVLRTLAHYIEEHGTSYYYARCDIAAFSGGVRPESGILAQGFSANEAEIPYGSAGGQ